MQHDTLKYVKLTNTGNRRGGHVKKYQRVMRGSMFDKSQNQLDRQESLAGDDSEYSSKFRSNDYERRVGSSGVTIEEQGFDVLAKQVSPRTGVLNNARSLSSQQRLKPIGANANLTKSSRTQSLQFD